MLPEAEAAHVLLFSCCGSTQGAEPYSARPPCRSRSCSTSTTPCPSRPRSAGWFGNDAKPVIDIGSQLARPLALIAIDCDDGEHVVRLPT